MAWVGDSGRDMEVNGELRPIVDRQLRTPEEMAAVADTLGYIATEVNTLLDGLMFDDSSYGLVALQTRLSSGLSVFSDYNRQIMLRPAEYSPLTIRLVRKPFYVRSDGRSTYVDMRLSDGESEVYNFWLPMSDQRVVAEPDTFTGLDDRQLVGVVRLINRIKDRLPTS